MANPRIVRLTTTRPSKSRPAPDPSPSEHQLWGNFQEKGLRVTPQYWFADDERVVVLTHLELGGEEADGADVLTYRDGQLVKFQTAADTALLERVYGSA